MTKQLAQQLRPQLEAVVKRLGSALGGEYSPDAASAAKRTLKNKALQVSNILLHALLPPDRCISNPRHPVQQVDHFSTTPGFDPSPVSAFFEIKSTSRRSIVGSNNGICEGGVLRGRGLLFAAGD